MTTKRALIVDDSRTAQFKLKKLLESYDLIIDTVSSAEEALGYLSYQKPDAIFMDHSMKGMNGLEAVRIIKSNTATATIPMVMYTAQSGDVYLSQARAIGAIDVLSKDVMTDSDIERVMSVLKFNALRNKTKDTGKLKANSPQKIEKSSDRTNNNLIQIRDQVVNSLSMQEGQFRRQLHDNTRLILNRFMREMRDLREETERQKNIDRNLLISRLDDQKIQKPAGISPFWGGILGALSLALIFTLWVVNEERTKYKQLMQSNQALTNQIEVQSKDILNAREQIEKTKEQTNTNESRELLQALVWAVNQTGRFNFNELALGDSRTEVITGLVAHLSNINFTGTLTLDIHNGDFCVVNNANGQLSLPSEPIPIRDCNFLSNSTYNYDQASQMSVNFINVLQSYPIVERGDLKINVQAHGLSMPSAPYPDTGQISRSDQWNNAALANNILKISLSN